MKPGATALTVTPFFELVARARRRGRSRRPSRRRSWSGRGCRRCRRSTRRRRCGRSALISPWSSSSRVIRSGAVRLTSMTESQRSPRHVGELLVAGDAGVVHDDVDAAVRRFTGAAIRCGASSAVMSRVSAVAAELVHHDLEQLARPPAGTSTPTTVAPSRCSTRAICSPMPRAAPVTSATLPVERLSSRRRFAAAVGAGRADPHHLAGDVRRLGGEQEREGRVDGRPRRPGRRTRAGRCCRGRSPCRASG